MGDAPAALNLEGPSASIIPDEASLPIELEVEEAEGVVATETISPASNPIAATEAAEPIAAESPVEPETDATEPPVEIEPTVEPEAEAETAIEPEAEAVTPSAAPIDVFAPPPAEGEVAGETQVEAEVEADSAGEGAGPALSLEAAESEWDAPAPVGLAEDEGVGPDDGDVGPTASALMPAVDLMAPEPAPEATSDPSPPDPSEPEPTEPMATEVEVEVEATPDTEQARAELVPLTEVIPQDSPLAESVAEPAATAVVIIEPVATESPAPLAEPEPVEVTVDPAADAEVVSDVDITLNTDVPAVSPRPDLAEEAPDITPARAETARPPGPLGLGADPTAPLLGGAWGASTGPSLTERLEDLGRDPRIAPGSPEAVSVRAATERALVAEGWLSAEELAAAHAALITPPVVADPADRAAQRAARAEARRAQAEAVAERRRTEILYLGRSVSEALHDHRGDPSRVAALGLPALGRPADLAERLGITVGRLRWLAFHAEVATRVHYVGFEVPKASGGVRRLSAPHQSLAQAQRWIFEAIVGRLPVEPEAHGFVPGRSILSNARPHAGQAVVVNLDLAEFFPSIGHRAVRSVFERAGYSPALATVLSLLCTEAPRRTVTWEGVTQHVATGPRGLPQGACTSPGLANQVARRLDRRLRGLADHFGATYTRYADDLTFSGGPDFDRRVGALLAAVGRIARSEGFRVHEGKTRVQRPNTAQTVTGLVVNDRPGVARVEARRLRAILHRARLEGLAAQNRAGHPDFRAHLVGRIAFVGMARPDLGARLLAEYHALDRPTDDKPPEP